MSLPLEVIWHCGFGKRYFGVTAFLAYLWFLIFASLGSRHASPAPLFLGGHLFLGLIAVRRLETWWQQPRVHSHYSGWPWLCNRLPISELTAKAWLIPFLSGSCGIFLMPLNDQLGRFLVIGAIGMHFKYRLATFLEQQREQDREDALFQAQVEADRFRRQQHHHRRSPQESPR